jgi:hypothetical protein
MEGYDSTNNNLNLDVILIKDIEIHKIGETTYL